MASRSSPQKNGGRAMAQKTLMDEAESNLVAAAVAALGEAQESLRHNRMVIGQQQVEMDSLRADAERWRWGVNNAIWFSDGHLAYIGIPVALTADLSNVAKRNLAIDAARESNHARGDPAHHPKGEVSVLAGPPAGRRLPVRHRTRHKIDTRAIPP